MKTLFVASTGGHLAQLNRLSARVPTHGPGVWVSDANEQSRSMLAGLDVEFVQPVECRSVLGVLRCLPTAHRLWQEKKITRAISTGSGIALGFLPYLAARGVQCHYIESAARVNGPSLTGKILRWVPGVRLYTQYPHWANRHWRYGGSQFDSYEPVRTERPFDDCIRVVVTVGASSDPFRRLIEHLVPLLAQEGPLHHATGLPIEVLWQTGATPVDDLPIPAKPFLPITQLADTMSSADIVISHAGTGSALMAFETGRAPLLVTRDPRRGEAIDGHQRELAQELSRRGLARHVEIDAITADELLEMRSVSVRTVHEPLPFGLLS